MGQLWWGLIAGLGATGTYTLGKRVVVESGAARGATIVNGSAASAGSPTPELVPREQVEV